MIFLPDEYMASNLRPLTRKRSFPGGHCIVHGIFTAQVEAVREAYPDVKVLVHGISGICGSSGGSGRRTGDMIRYVKKVRPSIHAGNGMRLVERLRVEFPDKQFVGTCTLCPHMKRTNLANVEQVLERLDPINPSPSPRTFAKKPCGAVERMLAL